MCDQPTPELSQQIEEKVRMKELEFESKSRMVAALLCAAMAAILAYTNDFGLFGEHSTIWSGVLGFVVGSMLGERLTFTLFGVLIGRYFYSK